MRSRNRAEQCKKPAGCPAGFGVWAAGGSAGIVRVVVSERHADDLGKPDEGDEVGKDHKAVEHVGQLPHEVHLQHGTKHDEAHDDEAIRRRALGAEQVLDVLLAEEIPADDGRKSEEEQADCHKGDAKGTEAAFKSLLGQGDAGGGAVDGVGHEDDEGCHIQHDKGSMSTQGQKRYSGFLQYLKQQGYEVNLVEVELWIGDEDHNEQVLDETFRNHPGIRGAVTFNSSCYILGDYLEKRQKHEIRLVGYDLIDPNVRLLNEGYVQALIAQRPELQGYNGVKALSRLLLFDERPQVVNLLPIDILLKENYQYYNKVSNLLLI